MLLLFNLHEGKKVSGSQVVSVGGLILPKITFFSMDVSNTQWSKIAFRIL